MSLVNHLRSSAGGTALCVLLAVVCVAGGCLGSPPRPAPPTALRLGAQDTPEAQAVLGQLLFAEPLISIDWRGRPVARLASEWQWLDDGRALELRLRPGVKFHDGSPLVATAVAAILRQRAARDGTQEFEYVTSIDAPADDRIVIHLSRPDAFILEAVAGTLIVDEEHNPDVGTGPFRIVSRTPLIRAVRNDDYYRGVPAIDEVDVSVYATQRAAWAAMMRGELDGVQEVNPDVVEFLEGASQFETYSTNRPFYISLVFNLRHPILQRLEVRRALVEAIDRDRIVAQAMGGHGKVADDPVWPSHWAYNVAARRYSYNPASAIARLEAAGFPLQPATRDGRMPSRFQLTCLFYKRDFQYERIALLLQRQLADVGVDLVLQEAEAGQIAGAAGKGNFDTFLFQLRSGRSFDWTYRFWHSGIMQNTGYTGVDRTLEELRTARTEGQIRVAVSELRERFYDDAPAAFLAWPETTRALDARFDVGDQSDPDIFANLWRWRIEPRQKVSP